MDAIRLSLIFFVLVFFLREYFAYRKNLFLKYIFTPLVMLSVVFVAFVSIAVNGPGVLNSSVLIGLIFALIADVMLMVEEVDLVKPALPFITMTHVIYISIFLRGISFEIWNVGPALFFMGAGIFMFLKLKENLYSFRVPVIMYILALSVMAYTAIVLLNKGTGYYEISVAAGGFLLWVSDVILATNKYIRKIENSTVFTWLFYAPGQLLIAFSAVTYFPKSM